MRVARRDDTNRIMAQKKRRDMSRLLKMNHCDVSPPRYPVPMSDTPSPSTLWQAYRDSLCIADAVGIRLDPSRMGIPDGFMHEIEPRLQKAYEAMDAIEAGAIANNDEGRRVGHYWLRSPYLAPDDMEEEIGSIVDGIRDFARAVHEGEISPPHGGHFTHLLQIGIGGSALGPMLVADCLGVTHDRLTPHFLDNTDPDGMYRLFDSLGDQLMNTLVLVVSKSGGTPETRNGMLETQAEFKRRGLDFAAQAVAITGEGSKLDKTFDKEGWLARFPMDDWVGGRTSVMSAVGLLPAALQGVDIIAFLDGASAMDRVTRSHGTAQNMAAQLAACWLHATGGRGGQGGRDMVILPYKDRLILLSRYLQQLVMESLGKKEDRDGHIVHQGISVYGNKGSTDQHAYVQQLRDGLNNFFATFITVLRDVPPDEQGRVIEVEDSATSGDFLYGFYLGTRQALFEEGRPSLTLELDALDARRLGALIALFERAVGLYAELIDINAYHQPGVEAGKKAAAKVIDLQSRLIEHLSKHEGETFTADEVAQALGALDEAEPAYHVLRHLAANGRYVREVEGNRFTASSPKEPRTK